MRTPLYVETWQICTGTPRLSERQISRAITTSYAARGIPINPANVEL